MKYFVIFLIFVSIVFVLYGNSAHGIWLPHSPEELLEQSEIIFVGNITSVNVLEFERSSSYNTEENGIPKTIIENYTLALDEYSVNVEEFVKNPLDVDTITVRQPTTSIPGKVVPHNAFDVGDRVLFYVEKFDGINTYSNESFLIPKQCDANSVVYKPRIIGSDFKMLQNNVEKKDNLSANLPITFIIQTDMGTLFGASLDYDVYVSKQVGKIFKDIVYHERITADAKPCEWLSTAQWDIVPDAGNYLVNGQIYKENSTLSISNKQFSVIPQLPLKQFKSGVPVDEIQCKNNLVLVFKKSGNMPACVSIQTKSVLMQRGWAESSGDFIFEGSPNLGSERPSGKPSMPPVLISTNGTGQVTVWPNSFLDVEVMCPTDNPYPINYQILFDKVPYNTMVLGVKHTDGVRDGIEYNGFTFSFENPTNDSESATILINCDLTSEQRTAPPEPEPERNPIPEGDYIDKTTYVYSVEDAESFLNYTLSTPYIPENTKLEKIEISNDKRKAKLYYSNGLEVSHHPMGRNFNNTHYIENPEREAGKMFYDFDGTFAEGLEIHDPFYSVIKILRDDRIYVRATMETSLDDLLKMIEPMDLTVPFVPYTPDPDYVMGAPEPEPIPEPEPEPDNEQ